MSTRFIAAGLGLDSLDGGTHSSPFGVDNEGALAIRRGSLYKGVASSDPGVERIAVDRFVSVTASGTLTVADHGGTFEADSTTSVVLQLPSTQKGLRYTMVVGQLTAASGHAFSPAAADKIFYGPTTAVDNKDLICSAATDRIGDTVTVVGDGVDGWYVVSAVGTFAAEA